MARRSASSLVGWGTLRRAAGVAIAASAVAACGLSVDDLFATGAGGSGSGGAGTATSTHASAQVSSSSASSTTAVASSSSSSSSTASSTTSSSSGGLVCGDGVCSPGESAVFCPQDCAGSTSASTGAGGADGGAPACDHPACTQGGALDGACDACAAMVCTSDPFCCATMWDAQCVTEAGTTCGPCCGDGACDTGEDCNTCPADCGTCPVTQCAHGVCAPGAALDLTTCHDPCAEAVCAQQPACCGNASWDMSCEALAGQLCGADPCVTAVCAATPSCCSSGWTPACVNAAKTACATACDCAHDACAMGDALGADCSPAVKEICKADTYCCSTSWDGICVGEVGSIGGIVCP